MKIEAQVLVYGLIILAVLFSGTIITYELGSRGDFNVPIHSLLTALYFTVVTLGTVGYGDIVPVAPIARAFVIILILVGLSVFLSAVTIISSGFVNSRIENMTGRVSALERRALKNHIILIGYGSTNAALAKMLQKKASRFIVIVSDKVTLDRIKSYGYKAFIADETLEDDMKQFELDKSKYIVVDTSDSARSLYAAIIAKNLAPSKPISVIAETPDMEKHLKSVGVSHIINPIDIAAQEIASKMV
ncbi:NAD-binding protein [Candidatus Marsarchaeota archaeon]|nr:NAD-binding protein [Candidatus Marsarchaeota archaeon]MCL5404790.1 NAD-binding protein [Candidatus Marsarchaeota archaeon]